MKNLLFFLWMLLFPLIDAWIMYIFSKATNKSSDGLNLGEIIVFMVVWFAVGFLLYER